MSHLHYSSGSKSMVVAVSGATSYLGRFFIEQAISQNLRILPIIRDDSSRRRLPASVVGEPTVNLENFARDQALLCEVSVIINMATCYGRFNETQEQIYSTNVGLPLMLMSAGMKHGVKNFINVGTALDKKVSSYAQTKHFADELLGVHMGRHIRFIVIKPDIFFGPGEKDSSKLPIRLIREMKAGVPSIALSPGNQLRFFLHVDDVASAIVTVLNKIDSFKDDFSSVGLGAEYPSSIREFALTAKRILNSKTALKFGALPYRESEPMITHIDQTTARQIGWRPRFDLSQAIADVIERDSYTD